ncbi:DUF6391 domain-containing protein [Leptolyngbya sp. FACHB-36]|uniref:DUF6391 domain-containing protein n=1 Tax=Leptolyngbya sp. FACHB-36 TaxID=2692808 RepID=UPI001F54FE6A|nr:DUF6391 domain-containing protein [Leptolyngbya sp. FACHB-36]
MTDSAFRQSSNFWEADLTNWLLSPIGQSVPQPTQDADLLQQLGFIPGLRELLMLRQVHALEHATVWVLSESSRHAYVGASQTDNERLGGMSTERGFYLYGEVKFDDLSRAVQIALRRITSGDWDLAVHPRCGTNLSVGMLLTAGLAVGMAIALPRGPIEQILGLGAATAMAARLTPDLGSLAQRYLTTAVPFNLAIANITPVRDSLGRSAHFVQVRWVE